MCKTVGHISIYTKASIFTDFTDNVDVWFVLGNIDGYCRILNIDFNPRKVEVVGFCPGVYNTLRRPI